MFEIIKNVSEIENCHDRFLNKLESFEHEIIPISLDSGRGDWFDDSKYIKSGNIWFTSLIGENDTEEGIFFNNFGMNKPLFNSKLKSAERCQICFSTNNATAGVFAINKKTNKIALIHNGRLSQIKTDDFFNSFDGETTLITDKKKEKPYAIICYLDDDNKTFMKNLSNFIRKVFEIKENARKKRLSKI